MTLDPNPLTMVLIQSSAVVTLYVAERRRRNKINGSLTSTIAKKNCQLNCPLRGNGNCPVLSHLFCISSLSSPQDQITSCDRVGLFSDELCYHPWFREVRQFHITEIQTNFVFHLYAKFLNQDFSLIIIQNPTTKKSSLCHKLSIREISRKSTQLRA